MQGNLCAGWRWGRTLASVCSAAGLLLVAYGIRTAGSVEVVIALMFGVFFAAQLVYMRRKPALGSV